MIASTVRTFPSNYPGTCRVCRRRYPAGTRIDWDIVTRATNHADSRECGIVSAVATASKVEAYMDDNADEIAMANAEMLADRQGTARDNAANLAAEIADEADNLLNEYDALQDAIDAALDEYDAGARKRNAAHIGKGIYRVSLTGSEDRYGVDCVNVKLVPSEKHNNITVSEWHGDGVGRILADGSVKLWPDVDGNNLRVQAILKAVDVILGAADPVTYAKAYAVEALACMRCGADLVDDESRARLMGPDCAQKGMRRE